MLKIPNDLSCYLNESGMGSALKIQPINGGYTNQVYLLETENRIKTFLKINTIGCQSVFIREADGLKALENVNGIRVPQIYGYGEDWLLMEFIEVSEPVESYWIDVGEGLAKIHLTTNEKFGFANDNFIGNNLQVNTWNNDGFKFFSEYRLGIQFELACQKGYIANDYCKLFDRLIFRLHDLIPVQPASLIHGDLWVGNLMCGPQGVPVFIDPAVYFGWAEADLAMTTLFGQFEEDAYNAYENVRPLTFGYRDRFDIYNLYHLLNHLNLFGVSYLTRVQNILDKYS